MKAWLDGVRTMAENAWRFFFGYDIFVSYSHEEAARYVPELANRLRAYEPADKFSKLTIYIDQWLAPPGASLPLSLVGALRHSSLLVLVVGEKACASSWVQEELREFLPKRRPVIPIVTTGLDLEKSWPELHRLHPVEQREEAADIRDGDPSNAVIMRIARATEFATQGERLRRGVRATVAAITVALIGAFATSSVIVHDANDLAARQAGIAAGIQTSIQADALRVESLHGDRGWAAKLRQSVELSIDSARRLRDNGQPPASSFRSLRQALDLLPRSVSHYEHEHEIENAWLTSNGEFLLTAENDGFLRVWGAVDHKPISQLRHTGTFTEDRMAMAAYADGRLAVIDLPYGTERWKIGTRLPASMKFSMDGSRLVADIGKNVIVFDAATGRQIVKVPYTATLEGFAMSPDDHRLALSLLHDGDNVLQLWDVANDRRLSERLVILDEPGRKATNFPLTDLTFCADGKLLAGNTTYHAIVLTADGTTPFTRIVGPDLDPAVIKGNNAEEIIGMVSSRDGTSIGTIGYRGTLQTFDAMSGAQIWSVKDHDQQPDRRYAAIVDEGGVEVVDISTGKSVARVLTGGTFNDCDYAPEGDRLLLYGGRQLWLYDLSNPQQTSSISLNGSAHLAGTSANGKYVVLRGGETSVVVWDAINEREIARRNYREKVGYKAAVSDFGRYVVTLTWDRFLHVWDTENGRELWRTKEPSILYYVEDDSEWWWNISSLELSPQGNYVLLWTGDGYHVWQTTTGRLVAQGTTSSEESPPDNEVTFSSRGRFLLAHGDANVELLDLNDGRVVARLPEESRFAKVILSDDEQRLAGVRHDQIVVWNVSGKQLYSIPASIARRPLYGFSRNGKFLVAINNKAGVILNADTGARLAQLTFERRPRTMLFSPSQQRVVVVDEKGSDVTVVDLDQGKKIAHVVIDDKVEQAQFTRDGSRILLSVKSNRAAYVLNVARASVEAVLKSEDKIDQIALSNDSRLLAIAAGNTIRIWELGTQKEMATLTERDVSSLRFVGDGNQLATLTRDNTARRWILDGDELIDRAARQLPPVSHFSRQSPSRSTR